MERTEMLEPNPRGLAGNWLKRGGRQQKLTSIVTLLDSRGDGEVQKEHRGASTMLQGGLSVPESQNT